MIAKVIVHGPDRACSLDRLNAALGALQVEGVATNRALLLALTRNADMRNAQVDTQWLDRNLDAVVPGRMPATAAQIALALSAWLADRAAAPAPGAGDDIHSPWNLCEGWRLNQPPEERLLVDAGRGQQIMVLGPGSSATLDGSPLPTDTVATGTVQALGQGRLLVMGDSGAALVSVIDPLARAGGSDAAAGGVVAPMPGRITKIHVVVGDAVQRGAPLVVVEAMKMEHTLTAPVDGRVAALHGSAGAFVSEGTVLVELDAA